MKTITATELARRTRQVLDAVAKRGETVMIERHHKVIARVAPVEAMMTAAQALGGLRAMLTPEQAAAWLKASREALDETGRDPWK